MYLNLYKLVIIRIITGIVLASLMYGIYFFTGNEAYILLYNVDYIPILQYFQQSTLFDLIFHFSFCIVSVVVLFYLLQKWDLAFRYTPYLIVYTGGAAVLFFLSALTERSPSPTDRMAWFYWTFSHLIYSIIVIYL